MKTENRETSPPSLVSFLTTLPESDVERALACNGDLSPRLRIDDTLKRGLKSPLQAKARSTMSLDKSRKSVVRDLG